MPIPPGGTTIDIVTSERHAAFLHDLLAAGIHLVWATTWQHAVIEPTVALGFPRLPVLPIDVLSANQPRAHTAMEWKMWAFGQAYERVTPLLFADDSAWAYRNDTIGPHGGPLRVIVPDERYGLVSRNMTDINTWSRKWAPRP